MKMPFKWLFTILIVLVVIGAGLRIDIDYCMYTAASVCRLKLYGITFFAQKDNGYRPWLEQEIGLKVGSDFVDYLTFHPIFPVVSTPPGNWLTLRRARQIYDDYPATRSAVRAVILRLQSRREPLFTTDDRGALDEIASVAAQSAAAKGTSPRR